ncbi:two-component system QseEF-associated lipoprotein QseG [Xenorhabdus sp. XENO-10]|uniref:Two-component system QseEF-associated lipoprotein QseG n=1 Tax=Xenorhabdus yunnanensis TaxID=3025878 RepID=A0ABT5LF52_9GAMM|nr:two-component system QseEF-associated lipoprotein QseG [Xenorhabdus yunnanensis]MDC9589732.1 two-component system QseEF-associated lipoprotein QseG [Xenorhabdus yunnanensis]
MYNRFTYRFMTEMQPILAHVSTLRFRAMLLLFVPYLLAGCVGTSGSGNLATITQSILPEQSVTDYRLKDCNLIWNITKSSAMGNGLYWLRFIDCTDRLSAAEAREIEGRLTPATLTDWHQVFKQSILIGRATSGLPERKRIVENFNRYSAQFPVALRPLLQLWREQQYLKINLAEEKAKFQRFQLDSENKIDRLKEARVRLENEFNEISRKLEHLTDIERQLSSRKQEQNNVATPSGVGQVNGADIISSMSASSSTDASLNNQAKPKDQSAANVDVKAKANSSEEKGAE